MLKAKRGQQTIVNNSVLAKLKVGSGSGGRLVDSVFKEQELKEMFLAENGRFCTSLIGEPSTPVTYGLHGFRAK